VKRIAPHQFTEDDEFDWEDELIEEYQETQRKRRPRRLRAEDQDEWTPQPRRPRSRASD
jgi:hypothetical protein